MPPPSCTPCENIPFSIEQVLELGEDEGATSVGGVNMKPHLLLLAQLADLKEVVTGTATRGAKGRTHLQDYRNLS